MQPQDPHIPGNAPQQPYMQPAPAPVPAMQPSSGSGKKRLLGILIPLLVLVLGGGAAAYYAFMVLPNTPENVFKKALANFISEPASYTASGRLDQGGANDADFDYEIRTSGSDTMVSVDSSTYVMGPKVEVQRIEGKTYVRLSQFYDSSELAKHYSNATGEKTIQDYMAEFTDKSGIFPSQDAWMEVNGYMLEQPAGAPASGDAGETDVEIIEIGSKEESEGKQVQNYKVSISRDGFRALLAKLDASGIIAPIFDTYSGGQGFPEAIEADVQVDIKSKSFRKLVYDGRPFKDATLTMNLVSASNTFEAPQAQPLTSKLSYGIVWSKLFNPIFQQGSTEADKERIADMKGIKTALEIYKAKNGHYPDRYSMAVNQESTLPAMFPGADFAIFTDPAGRFIGRNGSQYAYVGETADGNQSCGPHNGPACEKYFISTTLDNGQDYQLNSD